MERYSTQIKLDFWGREGQKKLQNTKILLVGCGGIGCPFLQYIVGAGVGTVTIMDPDIVSLSNLHRQILFTSKDLDQKKVFTAKQALEALNPHVTIHSDAGFLDTEKAQKYCEEADIIIDGSDSFLTKYILSEQAFLYSKPLFIGAVSGMKGYITGMQNHHYADIFPVPDFQSADCTRAGVLGPMAGMIGTLLAIEVIKHILDQGNLLGKVYSYDAFMRQTSEINFSQQTILQKPLLSSFSFTEENKEHNFIIDVRSSEEVKEVTFSNTYVHIPLPLLVKQENHASIAKNPVFKCASGKRAESAALLYALFLQRKGKKGETLKIIKN